MKYALLALVLSGCTDTKALEKTFACFDGMNAVCDLKRCTATEWLEFTRRCKRENGTDKPGLWSSVTKPT